MAMHADQGANKPSRQPEDLPQETVEAGAEGAGTGEKRKKPLLERLGIIELVVPRSGSDSARQDTGESPGTTVSTVPESHVETLSAAPPPPLAKHTIANIYEKFNLVQEPTRTVFLIEKYVKALPSNLPADIRRQTIVDLLQASQLSLSQLVQDGNSRTDVLRQFARDFAQRADEIIAEQQRQIRKLNEMVAQHTRVIEEHQRMKEAQHSDIEYELQNIANILKVVTNSVH